MATIAAMAAQADESAAPTEQIVITAPHYDNAVGTSDAASQGVVRAQRLADLPLLRPGEVLETLPGMVVTQHSGDGKANQYFLRGYNLDHGTDFASWLDGVPVNMPTNAHGQGYSDLNDLIPELVEKIEYRKGPYFADDGDFASAGSARIQYLLQLRRRLQRRAVGFDARQAGGLSARPLLRSMGLLRIGLTDPAARRPLQFAARAFAALARPVRALLHHPASAPGRGAPPPLGRNRRNLLKMAAPLPMTQ